MTGGQLNSGFLLRVLDFRIQYSDMENSYFKKQTSRGRQEITGLQFQGMIRIFMGQSGFLNGIKNIKSGNNIELLPYLLGTQSSYLADPYNPESEFKYDNPLGAFGVSGKYRSQYYSYT